MTLIWRQKWVPRVRQLAFWSLSPLARYENSYPIHNKTCSSSSNYTQNSRFKHQKKAKQFKYCLIFCWLRRNRLLSWWHRFGRTARCDYCSYKSFFRSYFWVGRYHKILNDWPGRNSELCFPSTSMLSMISTLRVLGKQNSLFSLEPAIKLTVLTEPTVHWLHFRHIFAKRFKKCEKHLCF